MTTLMDILIISDIPAASKEQIIRCFPSRWQVRIASPGHEERLLPSAEVIIPEHVVIDEEYLKRCPKLKMIQTGAGYDNIDLPACREAGVVVCNAAGVNANAVAEHTMALILAWYKNIAPLPIHPGSELCGLTVGIIGPGRIGQRVAKLCEAFDMKVLRCSHHPQADDVMLHTLLREADVVSLHVPLTSETRHMIGKKELKSMKSSAILVNTARGAVVNERELIEALQDGEIAGACLDVFEQEPLPSDSPLCSLTNVILTHHSAGYPDGPKFHRNRYLFFAENIRSFFEGREPVNRVV